MNFRVMWNASRGRQRAPSIPCWRGNRSSPTSAGRAMAVNRRIMGGNLASGLFQARRTMVARLQIARSFARW
jgi:hypothetical protein